MRSSGAKPRPQVPKSASEVQHEPTTLESPLPSLQAQPNIPSAHQKTKLKSFLEASSAILNISLNS